MNSLGRRVKNFFRYIFHSYGTLVFAVVIFRGGLQVGRIFVSTFLLLSSYASFTFSHFCERALLMVCSKTIPPPFKLFPNVILLARNPQNPPIHIPTVFFRGIHFPFRHRWRQQMHRREQKPTTKDEYATFIRRNSTELYLNAIF